MIQYFIAHLLATPSQISGAYEFVLVVYAAKYDRIITLEACNEMFLS